jgi:hypothetical protein
VEGLGVEGGPLAHVVADVGDGHPQAGPPVGEVLGVHRVVEITGVDAVDGDQAQPAQILPAVLPHSLG